MQIAIIAITQQGNTLAQRYQKVLPQAQVYSKYAGNTPNTIVIEQPLRQLVPSLFAEYDALVFIMATGIVVRCIAALVQHKSTDPAVVVSDEAGRFAISLLSGHLGGANQLAEQLAEQTGAQAVITTASDTQGKQSVDMFAKEHHLHITDWQALTQVTAILINGGQLVYRNETLLPIALPPCKTTGDATVLIRNKTIASPPKSVVLYARNLIIGVGCRKDKAPEVMHDFVQQQLAKYQLAEASVAAVVSVEVKRNEKAILELAKGFGVEPHFYTIAELQEVAHLFTESDFVKATIGVGAVCEPSAYLAGEKSGRFIVEKTQHNGMTLSIFETDKVLTIP